MWTVPRNELRGVCSDAVDRSCNENMRVLPDGHLLTCPCARTDRTVVTTQGLCIGLYGTVDYELEICRFVPLLVVLISTLLVHDRNSMAAVTRPRLVLFLATTASLI